eukprot:TRINITY_DN22850_c0_g1_i1.p1 TRINITY_DN22850_c0_g1~~TRINITY_DN22850_c0_g1_i1.p1  ORF type:complete len:122 (+),score=1.55 TRINITY_DN22850_c0_g1_i1:188-553(+)
MFEKWANIVALVLAGLAMTTHLTSGLATERALPWVSKIFLFNSSKSFLYIPGFLGKPPKKTMTSASLNIFSGSSLYSKDTAASYEQSNISMATPSRTFKAGVISSILNRIWHPGKTFPLRS